MTDNKSNVIPIGGLTKLDIPTDNVIEGIKDCVDKNEPVIVIGCEAGVEDTLYFASSSANKAEILLFLERAKQCLLSY